eukprot:2015092-Karenia_brevis.AAC.1
MDIKATTTKFTEVVASGRIQLTAILLPNNSQIYLFNLYGWVNSTLDDVAAHRTDDLFDAIETELAELPTAQYIICGDLNCSPDRLPTLDRMLDTGSVIDVGGHPEVFGQTEVQDTCRPHNTLQTFRRDFVFVSAELFSFISAFEVHVDPVIPVHSSLRIQLSLPGTSPTKTSLRTPLSLYGQFA